MQPSKPEEDRERYRELLEELRTIIPGAQVLFAFLLTVPFASRFSEVDQLERIVFAMSLAGVAVATILFLAPAAYHHIARHKDRRRRLLFGVRAAKIGMLFLGLSMVLAVFLVVRFLFDSTLLAGFVAVATAALILTTWVLIPVLRRRSFNDDAR